MIIIAVSLLSVVQIKCGRVESVPRVIPLEEYKATFSEGEGRAQNYTDHHLFVVKIETSHQKESLDRLEQETPTFDFWNPTVVSQNVSIRSPPELATELEKTLKNLNLVYTVASRNLQSWIEHEKAENPPQNLFLIGSEPSRFSLSQYHSYDEISAYLDGIASKYPDIAKVNIIGSTYEGRTIKGKLNTFFCIS